MRIFLILCGAVMLAAIPARAALAPNYQRLAELRAVLANGEINQRLQNGVIDRVEYIRTDLYRLSAGRCHVDVAIINIPLPEGVVGGRKFRVQPGRRICR